ncbi:MAG: hypothetical protein IT581_22935 [Verrucomicrobiales bacterium]|nr:hypothetical protein [Verrucomicrobiales bacterium]
MDRPAQSHAAGFDAFDASPVDGVPDGDDAAIDDGEAVAVAHGNGLELQDGRGRDPGAR